MRCLGIIKEKKRFDGVEMCTSHINLSSLVGSCASKNRMLIMPHHNCLYTFHVSQGVILEVAITIL